jgi:hypothetical protein
MIETTRLARSHGYQQGYIRTPRIGKTNPCNGRCGDQLGEQFETVSLDSVEALEVPQSIGSVLCGSKIVVRLITRKLSGVLFCHAQVFEIAPGEKVISPFSNIRGVTLKLCSHSRPTAIEITRPRNYVRRSIPDSTRRTSARDFVH